MPFYKTNKVLRIAPDIIILYLVLYLMQWIQKS